jgi:thiaminase
MSNERFRDELWRAVEQTVLPAILHHPFITGLVDASLPENVFR